MDLTSIINEVADSADDFLAGVSSMTEARTAIREYLATNHPGLDKADVQRVTAEVLAVLEEEGFFESDSRGDSWGGGDDDS